MQVCSLYIFFPHIITLQYWRTAHKCFSILFELVASVIFLHCSPYLKTSILLS
uniref:Uncharacterized protein n=1 Tax=Setaria italica TaxID=4555 RepID=K4A4A9_SETIT